jgi:SAM-dependent methyltransferase
MAREGEQRVATSWACPVCGGTQATDRFAVPTDATEGGVNPAGFRPSSDQFGLTVARVVTCTTCGHGALAEPPPKAAVQTAYEEAADPVSLREEAGQVETALRALADIEHFVAPGRLCDLGCWTGSFVAAAHERGWEAIGVEPSKWASDRARARGLDVRTATMEDSGLADGSLRLVVLCDVVEHLEQPASALQLARRLLEPGGALYITIPDAGSRLAKVMGRRWWSVIPMHLQYFTRSSARRLLEEEGFEVRSVTSHAKVFTARYYAERLGGYHPMLARLSTAVVDRSGRGDRLVAPDFRDRMAVIATKR